VIGSSPQARYYLAAEAPHFIHSMYLSSSHLTAIDACHAILSYYY
jgi:hypothetical protein